jgi:hypothetical protein
MKKNDIRKIFVAGLILSPYLYFGNLSNAQTYYNPYGVTYTGNSSSGMMNPHASVSGLLFAHPQATYFNLGKISKEQLIDYARRRQTDLHSISKYIRSEL